MQPVQGYDETESKRFYRMVLHGGMGEAIMADNDLLNGLNDADKEVIIKLMDKIRQMRTSMQDDSERK